MHSKYICLVIPTLSQGGMERVASELANYCIKAGYKFDIICLFKSKIMYNLDSQIDVNFPIDDYLPSLKNKIKTFNYLYSKLKYKSPDVVLGFGEIFNSLTIIVCRLLGIDVYISDRSSPLVSQGKFTGILKRTIYPFANGIIAQTEFAKLVFLKKKFNKNIAVIPNPLKNLIEFEKKDWNKSNNKIIVTIGRLIQSKNHHELIDIFSEINNLEWKFFIIGGGPLLAELKGYVKELGMQDNIYLLGPTDDVDIWLAQAEIFIYGSLTEGFPNALSEAVAYPVPSIAYDCPAGPSDIIKNDYNGLLIPLGNKKLFKKRLVEIMMDSDLREKFRRNSINNREKYSINIIGRNYVDFITSAD